LELVRVLADQRADAQVPHVPADRHDRFSVDCSNLFITDSLETKNTPNVLFKNSN
jgi:hypothetical protein